MKFRYLYPWFPLLSVALFGAAVAQGSIFTWDADGSGPVTDDGAGSWGGSNWFNGTSDVGWGDTTADEAIIGSGNGAAGQIDISGTVNANKLTFKTPGSGNYTLSGGTIHLGGSNATIKTEADATIDSAITGSTWTKTGSGTLFLNSSANSVSSVIISEGMLKVGTTARIGGPVTVTNGAVLSFTSKDPFNFQLNTGGLGNVDYAPSNLQLKNGTIQYTSAIGNTPSAYGTWDESRSFSTGAGGGTLEVVNAGVTWTLGSYRPENVSSSQDNIVNAGGLTISGAGNIDIRKYITGAGGVTMNGTGTLTLGGASSKSGWDNTYSGNTTINSGTLKLRSDYGTAMPIPHGAGKGNVIVNSAGTLDLNHRNVTINGLSGSGKITSSSVGAVTLTAGDNNQSSTFSGVIEDGAGKVGFKKIGAGTLTISSASTYSGVTQVSAGSLYVNGSLGNTATSVDAGATLGGAGLIGGATTVNGTLTPGSAAGAIGTLTFTENLALAGMTVFELNSASSAADRAIVMADLFFGGTLQVTDVAGVSSFSDGQTFNLFDFGTSSGTFSQVTLPSLPTGLAWDSSQLYISGNISIIPEPHVAFPLALTGLALLMQRRRK